METVTISKAEYEELKKKVKVDEELIVKFRESFEAIKNGKVTEWKPK